VSRAPATVLTRRGMTVILWALVASLACALLVEQRGLRWVQGVVWPNDLYAFQQIEQGPLDVAVIGSSRAAFGVSPSSLDLCLSQQLGRPTHSVNLSRSFLTTYAADLLTEQLLVGPRAPQVLVLGIEPEIFDEHNPKLPINVATMAGLVDIPEALGTVRDLRGLFAVLRPMGRGPETLALYASGRWDSKPWLRWMMLHHGGGMFCTGSEQCRRHNKDVEASLREWWDIVATTLLPNLKAQRFPAYEAGTGPVHHHTERLLARAERQGVQVVLMELPRHPAFRQAMPSEVGPRYQAYLSTLLEAHPLTLHRVPTDDWTLHRAYYVDAEHLTAAGAHRVSKDLCRSIAPLLAAESSVVGGE